MRMRKESMEILPLNLRLNPFLSLPPFFIFNIFCSVKVAILIAARAASTSESIYNVKNL